MPPTLRRALCAVGAVLLIGACLPPGAAWAGGRRHRPRARPPLVLDLRAFDAMGECVAAGCPLRAERRRRVGCPALKLPGDFDAEIVASVDEVK